MYALHVTFTSTASAEDLRTGQLAFAQHVTSVPGFVSKTWLHDGADQGGFYLFADRAAAQQGEQRAVEVGLRGNPAVAELTVRGWAVDVELAARTHATPAHAG